MRLDNSFQVHFIFRKQLQLDAGEENEMIGRSSMSLLSGSKHQLNDASFAVLGLSPACWFFGEPMEIFLNTVVFTQPAELESENVLSELEIKIDLKFLHCDLIIFGIKRSQTTKGLGLTFEQKSRKVGESFSNRSSHSHIQFWVSCETKKHKKSSNSFKTLGRSLKTTSFFFKINENKNRFGAKIWFVSILVRTRIRPIEPHSRLSSDWNQKLRNPKKNLLSSFSSFFLACLRKPPFVSFFHFYRASLVAAALRWFIYVYEKEWERERGGEGG